MEPCIAIMHRLVFVFTKIPYNLLIKTDIRIKICDYLTFFLRFSKK